MFNLGNITEKDNNKDWSYRKLIIGPSGSVKTNYLLNSIQKDKNIIDKTYLYAKDLEELKLTIDFDGTPVSLWSLTVNFCQSVVSF